MKRVLILYGGRSAEHEISIISARFIETSLDRDRFEPLLVAIDPEGRWHHQTDAQLPRATDPRQVQVDTSGPLAHLLPMPDPRREDGTDRPGTLYVEGAAPVSFDVAFPVLHGPYGEDGCVQGLFELAGVPYVGAGVTGSAVGMDKLVQKQVFQQVGLSVLPYTSLTRAEWVGDPDVCVARCAKLRFPLFVKPVNMGSSLGIGRVQSVDELPAAIEEALSLDTRVVVEEGLDRPREIECSVLGDDSPRASLPGEINVDHPDGWYSYAAKYLDDGAELAVPAKLDAAATAEVREMAVHAFSALALSGMARVDMFMGRDGKLFLNEVNTIPGFTAISMYPRMWEASDLPARELVSELIDIAERRHAHRGQLATRRTTTQP